jgi:hypothetical protein
MIQAISILSLAIVIGATDPASAADEGSILTYHGAPDRSGNFVVPVLTAERAHGTHLDSSFQAKLSGHLYAQPLFWREARRVLLKTDWGTRVPARPCSMSPCNFLSIAISHKSNSTAR